ncbi:Uncharacterised protein [Legionella steigerwaltii]|uniref:Uncharacterized protein n=1 Tax=Legionella steigerwaltii TaxID=460 RepID=A0A378LFF9_9GAMM|nr:hypothetical protein [Legionella steigerwaltii]KTD77511.1 hypothetical protein Lstg_1868 [Legionella steigerwaltii]STY22821.1 Uncharacterised protein [Legionella steigerwaltii]
MRNTKQQNQNPFDELASEMLLEVLNARHQDENYILNPKDMASVALSCQRFNSISLNANCIFFPHEYKDIREKASDYHDYKERQLRQLRYEQRVRNEKGGSFYWNKTLRKAIATGLSLLLASLLAFTFDMDYTYFFLTTIVLTLMTLVINELLQSRLELSLDESKMKNIPLQFFEEEIASNVVTNRLT